MKREDDRRNPLKADALRGFFCICKWYLFKMDKGKECVLEVSYYDFNVVV